MKVKNSSFSGAHVDIEELQHLPPLTSDEKMQVGNSMREVFVVEPEEKLPEYLSRRLKTIKLSRESKELNLQFVGRLSALDNNSIVPTQVVDPDEYNKARDRSFEARARGIDMEHWLMSHSPYMPDDMYRKLACKYTGETETSVPGLFVRDIEFDKTCDRIAKESQPLMVIANEPPALLSNRFNRTTVVIRKVKCNDNKPWYRTPYLFA